MVLFRKYLQFELGWVAGLSFLLLHSYWNFFVLLCVVCDEGRKNVFLSRLGQGHMNVLLYTLRQLFFFVFHVFLCIHYPFLLPFALFDFNIGTAAQKSYTSQHTLVMGSILPIRFGSWGYIACFMILDVQDTDM